MQSFGERAGSPGLLTRQIAALGGIVREVIELHATIVFEELDEFLPHLERLQFKGGEPFLARENQRIWDRLIELGLTPEVTVTTNGTLFNDRVAHYVRELRMHPNISVDGMEAETIEAIRVGVDAQRLWHNIDRFQELAEEAGNGMTLSFCAKARWALATVCASTPWAASISSTAPSHAASLRETS